ncbi:hypothetical protein COL5a_010336 [Colletotrichum fioriniae]|nr:hypothetical protein COL5a_010336 [Colletotrichum fioriniae]
MVNTPEAQPASPPAATSPPVPAAEPATTASPQSPQRSSPPTNPPAAVAESDALEAEDPVTSLAETCSDRLTADSSSYTASLASSAVDYPIEFGRRYHAFRPGGKESYA